MNVFVTGGTGYIGSRLIPILIERGHRLRALVRKGSEVKLPIGAAGVVGDALKMDSYSSEISPADTFVHLIGVPHPSPAKAKQFQDVDLVSIRVAVKAARKAGIRHFVLSQRGASRAGDESIHRGAAARRRVDSRERNGGDIR